MADASECKLCSIYEKRQCMTRLYSETSSVIVVQAFNSGGNKNPRLMCILKKHTSTPTEEEKQIVEGTLRMVADSLNRPYTLEPEKVVEHYHRHANF